MTEAAEEPGDDVGEPETAMETREELSGALVVHALRRQRRSVNALAGLLGVPRSAVLSVLAGNARAGTVALVVQQARSLGWLPGAVAGGVTGSTGAAGA